MITRRQSPPVIDRIDRIDRHRVDQSNDIVQMSAAAATDARARDKTFVAKLHERTRFVAIIGLPVFEERCVIRGFLAHDKSALAQACDGPLVSAP
jgi:hypothetical protein